MIMRFDKIFTIKNWQLFLLLCTTYIFGTVLWSGNSEILGIKTLYLSVTFSVITLIIFFSWVFLLGVFLNSIKENTYRFNKWFLLIASLLGMFIYIELNLSRLGNESFQLPVVFSILLAPLGMLGILYTFYNVPKSLKTLELGRKAHLTEFILDSLLMFAFPIGIWFIQPRINKIYKCLNEEITFINNK